ncbi:transketolase [Chitinimonas arctica]|uniref:Transketolase n=1 Tax=Chitinimonas arctica TaxID=2594795 RepID=A0A516SBF3_9NEIS|nr:transketolase [Chitinimonas arctica]QDQ25476.1 transketolase [Chitinimonas arctica]
MSLAGRVAYREELTRLAHQHPEIVCLEADLGGAKHPFQEAFPDRFYNLGIAEAAAVDCATAIALNGYTPFFSTFAPFAVLRSAESIKLSLAYMGANIKVVAPYAGVAGGWFGTTHHCLEDFAVIRSFPGIRILAPYGEEETREMVRLMVGTPGPFYMRLGRNGAYASLDGERDSHGIVWQGGSDQGVCLVSAGEMGTVAVLAAREQRGDLAHAHLCMLDQPALEIAAQAIAARCHTVLVVEEHRPMGGIGSALALLMPDCRVHSFNCGEKWPNSGGSHEEVLESLGFSTAALLEKIDTLTAAMA